MFLDKFNLDSLTLQYDTAPWLWDHAGDIAVALRQIWPDLELLDPVQGPQQQQLRCKGLHMINGVRVSTVTLSALKSVDPRTVQNLKETFEVWRRELSLEKVNRISNRIYFAQEFPSMKEANAALFALNLARWPSEKVFDQPQDSGDNAMEIAYKFEDPESFSFLRLRTERMKFEVKLDPPFDDQELKKIINRMVVDFDRGLLGTVDAANFRMDEWLKGFQHLLRRDIDKVLGVRP